MEARSLRSVSMSRTCGKFSRMTSSSVRMAAAMHGSAEFFAPETLMVPRRGLPPRITNLSIRLVYGWRVWMRVAEMVRIWLELGRREWGFADRSRLVRTNKAKSPCRVQGLCCARGRFRLEAGGILRRSLVRVAVRTVLTPAATMAVSHRLELLELVWCENRRELLLGVLVDRLHLRMTLVLREGLVLEESLGLLVAVGEDRGELRGLVRGEVQLLGEELSLTLRIGRPVMLMVIRRIGVRSAVLRKRRLRLLCERRCARESQGERGGKKKTFHQTAPCRGWGGSPRAIEINTISQECCGTVRRSVGSDGSSGAKEYTGVAGNFELLLGG